MDVSAQKVATLDNESSGVDAGCLACGAIQPLSWGQVIYLERGGEHRCTGCGVNCVCDSSTRQQLQVVYEHMQEEIRSRRMIIGVSVFVMVLTSISLVVANSLSFSTSVLILVVGVATNFAVAGKCFRFGDKVVVPLRTLSDFRREGL
ncbi:hypothetical protein [Halomonas huangheensis]|uniref:Uncharacterized protein n=1 Tax=Halomonas huangheensis TaxID=1178482 RepID=W1N2Q0_9GAMM|nr:hypothetical protein [Halomonas huangheensis]ALM52324.1 hypothetical protein AR456_08515 [Halomonas huangheensis]ERL49255.1 hypothetical protein BJB45_07200 [Halomonas huangheensis]